MKNGFVRYYSIHTTHPPPPPHPPRINGSLEYPVFSSPPPSLKPHVWLITLPPSHTIIYFWRTMIYLKRIYIYILLWFWVKMSNFLKLCLNIFISCKLHFILENGLNLLGLIYRRGNRIRCKNLNLELRDYMRIACIISSKFWEHYFI